MSWMEFVRTVWPIAATITPFILAGGFAWLKSQFPTKADLEKLRADSEADLEKLRGDLARDAAEMRLHTMAISDRQIAAEHRLNAVESSLGAAPSKLDLSKDIGKVAERVGRVESGIEALNRQIGTHNDYLHTIIEKHLP